MSVELVGNHYLPSFLPDGYSLSHRVEGGAARGFGKALENIGLHFNDDQLAYVFRTGSGKDAWVYPLAVYAGGDPSWSLTGTEHRRGRRIDIGIKGATAVYHDGMWSPVAGEGENGRLEWVADGVHSLTVRFPHFVWAARGSRSHGVSREDLVRMAKSLSVN
jgi:hypothetical protein